MKETAKVRPAVAVMLDKERHLKLTLSGMIAFQEATGKNILDPETTRSFKENTTLADVRALLWACLRHEDKELTLEQAGDLIDAGNMDEVVKKIGEAFNAAMPESEGKETDPLVRTSPAGSTSGPSADST